METTALEYYSEVKGKKIHYIFRQGVVFYVFTESEGGNSPRGHFSAIPQSEVNAVEGHIKEYFPVELFHPRELNMLHAVLVKDRREERMRDICYILVAQGGLSMKTVAREIQFRQVSRPVTTAHAIPVNQKQRTTTPPKIKEPAKQPVLVQRGGGYFICPLCKAAITKEFQRSHNCRPTHRIRK